MKSVPEMIASPYQLGTQEAMGKISLHSLILKHHSGKVYELSEAIVSITIPEIKKKHHVPLQGDPLRRAQHHYFFFFFASNV